ncbi:lysosome-associated membrane glycoprotein 1 isoform X2 [Varanus komodoensis]|uniref:lysosome-associated membrane glycoprotein 1 isoform X2 n=1 Tax=Varanus komodoensis TaxID=61221 RepID=UPI001CF7E987|nr:lysosome-associated membrane glycoprotein 1 isoform X2 [Varanus komodoensis]
MVSPNCTGFLQASSAFQVKNKDGKICILANFSAEFTVDYVTQSKKVQNVTFTLPANAHVLEDESTCGGKDTSQVIAVGFGYGHSLSMTFEKKTVFYMVTNLTFKYNLSDATFFHDAVGSMEEATKETDIKAHLDTRFMCHNKHMIHMRNVTVRLSNVTLEAYLPNNTFSKNETICAEDKGSTTPVVPTTPVTTATHIPITTSSAPPTPSKIPDTGRYNVTGLHGTCLLASMGLQVNVTYTTKNKTDKSEVLNLPANASYSGTCENATVTLNVTSRSVSIFLSFAQNSSTEKYFLQVISVSAGLPPEAARKTINAVNNTLSALQATVGKSYKCVSKESIWLSSIASVNIYNVQIQAFKISGNKFGAVEECPQDENNMLIPIIVGAALAGLVLIVLIAYLIGRKRSHAGYQTI